MRLSLSRPSATVHNPGNCTGEASRYMHRPSGGHARCEVCSNNPSGFNTTPTGQKSGMIERPATPRKFVRDFKTGSLLLMELERVVTRPSCRALYTGSHLYLLFRIVRQHPRAV